MRSLIVYSGTGNTRKEAQELAGMLGADLAEVRCDRYRAGFFGYLRAAYGSVKRRLPAIEFLPTSRTALRPRPGCWGRSGWAAQPCRPARSWPHRRAPDWAFAEMEALLAAPAEAKLALRAGDTKGDRLPAALRPFVAQLVDKKAAA